MTEVTLAERPPRGGRLDPIPLDGPIAVTGASGQVGTALQLRLAEFPNEARVVGRDDDPEDALWDAAVVVHLAGTLRPARQTSHEEANLGTVRRTVGALAGSSVERVIFLSHVGADPRAENAYLRAKGEAEDILFRCGRDCVVFRCTHIFGPPAEPGPTVASLTAAPGRSLWVLGDGSQRVAPVYRDDVVDAIVAALDPRTYHGRFDLPGAEVLTMDSFARIVNDEGTRLRHLPPRVARALSHATREMSPELADIMLSDCLGEQRRVDRTFGLERRGVSDVYSSRSALAA
jgi:uncharacterized protein YbjT (DUF2867 family)